MGMDWTVQSLADPGVMGAVELMQTSAKAAVFAQLPHSLKWKTLTSCCHHSSPKEVVEDNIGDGKAITYDHLYRILFDHVGPSYDSIHSNAMYWPSCVCSTASICEESLRQDA